MAAYLIVDIDVKDPKRYAEYVKVAPDSIGKYGGRYLVRGGQKQVLEGAWELKRFVIVEFENADRARAWWSSSEYAGPKAMRQAAAVTNMVLVEGI